MREQKHARCAFAGSSATGSAQGGYGNEETVVMQSGPVAGDPGFRGTRRRGRLAVASPGQHVRQAARPPRDGGNRPWEGVPPPRPRWCCKSRWRHRPARRRNGPPAAAARVLAASVELGRPVVALAPLHAGVPARGRPARRRAGTQRAARTPG